MTQSPSAPTEEAELAHAVAGAYAARTPLTIMGGGSKSGVGRPPGNALRLDVSGLSGIVFYDPAEMVIRARAGTPLAEVEAALAERGQTFAFEPPDWRELLGTTASGPTIGGLVSANSAGPRRVVAGSVRDALIGLRFVNGLGQAIASGGRVMKNVTGYDLVKLLSGAWGTLGVVTEATFKVVPRAETEDTLAFSGLAPAQAIALMSEALGSPFEVSGAAHLPGPTPDQARTYLRIENFAPSVRYRSDALARHLSQFGAAEPIGAEASRAVWRRIGTAQPMIAATGAVWRVSVAPSKAAAALDQLKAAGATDYFFDWGGGLIWVAAPQTPSVAAGIRAAARVAGGHAMVLRADAEHFSAIGAWGSQAGPLAALTARIKTAFDPAGILNPGRMGAS